MVLALPAKGDIVMRKRRITRRLKAPKTTELIAFLKGKLDEKKLKVGDVLYTNDEYKMLAPEGFHKPTAQDILNTSVRAGILSRVARGQAVITEALRDFSVKKILGILKRRNRAEDHKKAGGKNKRRRRSSIMVMAKQKDSLMKLSVPVVSSSPAKVVETLVNECSLEELMSAVHAKAVQLLEKEISEKNSSIARLGRLQEEIKRLDLITA